jgi:hypothetical protein
MCFSATASFTASAMLLAAGVATWRMAARSSERPLAALPLLFGVQQLSEGLLWSGVAAPQAAPALTWIYAFFSHVLWPVYVPIAVWLVEAQRGRRRAIAAHAVCGLLLGSGLLASLLGDPLVATAVGGHIEYTNGALYGPAVMLSYLAVTTGSLLISSRPWIRLFGLAAFASFLLAYAAYARWVVSVWCFFAAALSGIVWVHFAAQPARASRAYLRRVVNPNRP